MATGFQTAQADIEQQRRDANAAIAAAGSAGAAAFAQGQQQIEAARTTAVGAALSEAAKRGQGNIGGVLSGQINTPYAQLGAGLSSSAASHAADSAMMGGAADRYFREVGAAVPVSAQNLEAAIARQKAKAAQANQLSDSELRTRLMGAGEIARDEDLSGARHTHHELQQRVEKAKAGISLIDHELRKWQHGKSDAHPHELIQMKNQLEAELATARTARAPITQSIKGAANHPIEEYARQAGLDAGEDPYRVAGLIKAPKAAAGKALGNVQAVSDAARQIGIHGPRLRKITGNDEFATISSAVEDDLKKGVPFETVAKNLALYKPGHIGRIKALVLAMYQPAFASQG